MAWRTFLEFYKCFAPRKVYLVVAGGLLITSLIASIFMFGLRDTVSILNGYCLISQANVHQGDVYILIELVR